MTQRDPAKQLAKELADLRKEVRSGSSASQMRFRALEGGAIPVYDTDGTLRGQIGQLNDGTTGFSAVNGPKPPRPSNPIVFPLIGGLDVTWNGETFDGSPLPGDFKALEVHASPFSVYTPDATTIRANLIRPGTITLALPSGGPWTVVFVIRSTSDVRSDPSLGATETPEHAPTEAEITDLRSVAEQAETAAQTANAKALEAVGLSADKGKVYAQPDPPTGDPNGLWIDTNDSNKPYVWKNNTWTLVRDAGITSAQAAADTAIAAAGDAKAIADGKVRTFFQDAEPTGLVAGDVGDLWFDTNDANRMYRWSGTAWVVSADTRIAAAVTAANDAATLAGTKIVTFYQNTAPPTTGRTTGDLWVNTGDANKLNRWNGAWTLVRDTGIQAAADAAAGAQGTANTALTNAGTATQKANDALASAEAAQTTANGRNRAFWRASTNPPPTPLITGDLWFVTDQDNKPRIYSSGQWNDAKLGDGAIANLNVGKLTTGQLNVGQRIIAGLITGTHAEMSDTGFRVFSEDPTDGIPNEVVRMGTETNDFIGVVGADGGLLAAVDDTGGVNGRYGNFRDGLVVKGRPIDQIVNEGAASAVGYFQSVPTQLDASGNFGPIRARIGIAEVNAYLYPGRRYRLTFKCLWSPTALPTEAGFKFTYTGPSASKSDTAPAPMTTDPVVEQWLFPSGPAAFGWQTASGSGTFEPTTEGRHRFLLNVERGTGNDAANLYIIGNSNQRVTLWVEDLGPATPNAGSLSYGGGQLYQGAPPPPPPAPTQQYVWENGPAGRGSWTGSGQYMDWVGGDVYQGYHPSNGSTKGQFWFDLPPITGTVDRVDLYLYFRHWYYNSGGLPLLTPSDRRGTGPDFYAFGKGFFSGGSDPWPKPGGRWVTLPSDWWPLFRGTTNTSFNTRATAINLGPSFDTNLLYYGIATDARLKIWYTQ